MRPRDETRFFYALAVECVEQQRLQMTAQPIMHGNVESLFFSGEHVLRQFVLHQIAEQELQLATMNAVISRKSGREFDNAVIEEGWTDLEGVRHAHSIDLGQQVVGQEVCLIECHEATDIAAARNCCEEL